VDLADPRPGDPPWLRIASRERGTSRFGGTPDNPRIQEYLHSTTIGPPHNENDETPWCSAFVNFCVEKSGHKGTKDARARSWLNWGLKADAHPVRGCIVVLERGPVNGHVGFFLARANGRIQILGGNQSGPGEDAVNISGFPESRVIGFRQGPIQEDDDMPDEKTFKKWVREVVDEELDKRFKDGVVKGQRNVGGTLAVIADHVDQVLKKIRP
jgi:uncharacterized protein (TIGR02594 family)